MNWIQKLFQQKQVSTEMFVVGPSQSTAMDMSADQISKDAYRKLTVAYRCVDLIAGAAAGINLILFQGDKEIDKHDVISLLKKPHPLHSYMSFTKCVISYFTLHGNAFIQGVGEDPRQPPVRLICHRTSRMKIIGGANLIPSEYVLRLNGGGEVRFPVDVMGRSQIMHMKTFNPLNDWWGQSPVTAAATDVDTLNSANRWNLSLLQNSARPSGVFFYTGEGSLSDTKKRTLRKDIDRLWAGEVAAGKPLVLGGKIDFKELSLTPKDMDFLNSKKVSKADIALSFGVPSQLVGIEGTQTFANFAQAQLSFYVDTVIPILKMYVGSLNNWLLPTFRDNLELRIDFDSVLALEPLRKIQWEKAQNASWLTADEKRALTGFEPYDASTDNPAEKIYQNASLVPLGEELDFEIIEEEEEEEEEEENEKAFNISSRRGKRQFWVSENKRRIAFTKRMRAQLNAAFKKQAKEIISAIDGAQSNEMIDIIIKEVIADSTEELFRPIFERNIKQSMLSFGLSTIRAMNKKAAADKLDFGIRRFIEREVGNKITAIANTSQKRVVKRVREAILNAEIEGQSVQVAAKAIEGIYKDFTAKRSLVIARTEIHNAAMIGSVDGAKATGVPNLIKEWVSNFQAGFRENHGAAMDGAKVPIDEKFMVPSLSGAPDAMDGPGDSSAPADQVINCSCVLIYGER